MTGRTLRAAVAAVLAPHTGPDLARSLAADLAHLLADAVDTAPTGTDARRATVHRRLARDLRADRLPAPQEQP